MRPLSKKLARLQRALKADVTWGLKHGYRWNAKNYATYNPETRQWDARTPSGRKCGVCAIGMAVVRRQLDSTNVHDPAVPAEFQLRQSPDQCREVAAAFGVPQDVVDEVFYGVTRSPRELRLRQDPASRIALAVLQHATKKQRELGR